MTIVQGFLVGALVLLGCTALRAAEALPVKSVETRAPLALSAADPERRVVYKKTVMVATDEKFGEIESGIFCSGAKPLMLTAKAIQAVTSPFALAARRELKELGFKDVAMDVSAFAAKDPAESGDYELAATIRAIDAKLCTGGMRDNAGAVWMRVHWELFSPKQQAVVYSITTEGSFASERKIEKTLADYFDAAFVSSMRNALSEPAMAARLRADPARPSNGGPGKLPDLLALARLPDEKDLPDGEFTQHRSAVVTVMSGVGSGTGFYIDPAGYLLTNRHVVGDAKYVKIRLATARDLVGEVIRSDAIRDVALVKTEPVSLRALALSSKPAVVGDEVYVIGSPFGENFATSLTKGVLSGTPVVEQRRYLQSDSKVLPGNSGGPLIRRDGAVIGICAGGFGQGPGASVNLFIPIDDALSKVGLTFRP